MPSLIASIAQDLKRGDAAIVQLVTTSEALLERRLADTPVAEWGDLTVDITPREYVLDYLKHSFPTKVFETKTDKKGNKYSEAMVVDGNYVESQEAAQRRDMLLERLQSLPPIQSALDQIIQHFGVAAVAEITGRKRRIVKKTSDTGTVLAVESRSASSNLAETQAFMDDEKNILIFSDAGGTGRSYHADMNCRNQRQRIHYLLEPGWKADNAIQGLGRSNRTNQKQPPIFRPVTTNVKGERRFISTIARRLDRMGAITRGERRTGGQGMFRPEDNLENEYAWSARREFFRLLVAGKVACCSYQAFKDATGLNLTDGDSTLRDDLPPMHTLLNRLLALRIEMQNQLFEVLEGLIVSRVEAASRAADPTSTASPSLELCLGNAPSAPLFLARAGAGGLSSNAHSFPAGIVLAVVASIGGMKGSLRSMRLIWRFDPGAPRAPKCPWGRQPEDLVYGRRGPPGARRALLLVGGLLDGIFGLARRDLGLTLHRLHIALCFALA